MTTTLTKQILRLACRTTGVASDEVPGKTIKQVSNRAGYLTKAGLLFKVVIDRRHVRYFATLALRTAFLATHAARHPADHRRPTDAATEREQLKAPWPKDAQPHFPEGWKFTRCPSHEPPFQAIELPGFHAAGNQRGRVMPGIPPVMPPAPVTTEGWRDA